MAVKSLWGDLPAVEDVKVPKTLLWEQAEALSQATGQLLRGEVRTESPSSSTRHLIIHTLFVVAPALNNYRTGIVQVMHDAVAYPVQVVSLINNPNDDHIFNCQDFEDFEAFLGTILQGAPVRRVIASLLAQVKA